MSDLPITGFYAALLALLALPLTVQVSARRALIGVKAGVIHKAVFGDADDPMLRNAIRAFGNFMEYVPLALIVFGLAELRGASAELLWWLGGIFVAGRIVHAASMSFIPKQPAPRGLAMFATYAMLGVSAVCILLSF